tara:strand:+ start:367 stop:1758 length:1392 start_codon:yes stop_codon:yes gene_type:complete
MRFGAIFVLVALLAVTTPVIFAEELSLEMVLEVPAPPTNLIASSGLPIDLSWTASPEPNPDMPVTHYSIEKSVNGGVTWSVLSANIGNVQNFIDSDVVIGSVYDYRVKAHNKVGDSISSNISTATAIIKDSEKIRNIGAKVGETALYVEPELEKELETEFEHYILTQDDLRGLFDRYWKIINVDTDLSDTEFLSSTIIIRDGEREFDPVYKKNKIPAITVEIYQFEFGSDQEDFWFVDEYEQSISDLASISGFSETTGDCFFENSIEGGMSGCSYENIIIQVTTFDLYEKHLRTIKKDVRLESEPTLKVLNKVIEKINDFKGRDHGVDVVNVLLDKIDRNQIVGKDLKQDKEFKEIDTNTDPEDSLRDGINYFSCKKDDFGVVSIAGEFANGVGFVDGAKITISLTDGNDDIIISDSNNFDQIEKYDTRKFVAYVKTNERFNDCNVEIKSDDGSLVYERSIKN